MVLAFSLQSELKSVGAYAGLAAVIGLALLILLYFAQAREIRRLSELLEDVEDRARGVASPSPIQRPMAAPSGPVATAPASATVTTAVPGVRRVAVGAAGAVAPASAAGGAVAATVAGVVPAATVAGAMASGAPAAPAPSPSAPGADVTSVAAPRSAPAVVAAGGAETTRVTAPKPDSVVGAPPAADPGAKAPPSPAATPPAAIALSAGRAATAEPVGAAQALGAQAPPGDAALDEQGPDTAENEVVTSVPPRMAQAPAAGVADAPRAAGVAGPPPAPASPPALDATERREPTNTPGVVSAPPPAEDDEPPPLAPSTPAGARPRFPPAPEVRAEPVGAAARVSGRTLGAAALDAGGAATTRRRERERERVRIEDDDDPPRGSPGSTLRLIGAAIVIAAVLIFVAIKVIGGGSSTPPGSPTNSSHTNTASVPSPSTVTVAVLNGTQTKGLATRVSAVFVGKGFLKGVVGNAPSPNHTTTLVSYTTGNRAAAREVAKDLAPIKPRVGPVDAATAAVADAHGGPPNVVVTLGSDYSQR